MWNPNIECMDRDELQKLQLERLQKMLRRISNVPLYKKKFEDKGMDFNVSSLGELKDLPFTYKTDLRDTYPFGMFAASQDDVVRIHASSGTTGKQTVVGYTKNDLDAWNEIMARTIAAAGGGKSTVLQVSYGYGLFTGGLGAHYGGERIGASVVPTSSGNTQRQLQIMKDFGVTMLACTPSYALYLGEAIEEAGIKQDIKLRSGIFGAEPWTDNMRSGIEKKLGIKAYDIYGLSEIMGPGVSYECECQNGLHINEDFFIPEIIDPDTEKVLPVGEVGELVFTTITKEALPLLRYRTRDITRLTYEKCPCGRTHARMEKTYGRSDDMLIIRGVNVFPSQIESVLLDLPGVEPHYIITVDRVNMLDTLEVAVEMSEGLFSDEVRKLERLEQTLTQKIQDVLGISVKVRLVEPRSIARSEGKAKRIIDNRRLT